MQYSIISSVCMQSSKFACFIGRGILSQEIASKKSCQSYHISSWSQWGQNSSFIQLPMLILLCLVNYVKLKGNLQESKGLVSFIHDMTIFCHVFSIKFVKRPGLWSGLPFCALHQPRYHRYPKMCFRARAAASRTLAAGKISGSAEWANCKSAGGDWEFKHVFFPSFWWKTYFVNAFR